MRANTPSVQPLLAGGVGRLDKGASLSDTLDGDLLCSPLLLR